MKKRYKVIRNSDAVKELLAERDTIQDRLDEAKLELVTAEDNVRNLYFELEDNLASLVLSGATEEELCI